MEGDVCEVVLWNFANATETYDITVKPANHTAKCWFLFGIV